MQRDPMGDVHTLQQPPASVAVGDRASARHLPRSLSAGTEHGPQRRHPEDAGGAAGWRGRRA